MSVGIMASSVVTSGGVILLEDCDNFTDAPWTTGGSVAISSGGGFSGNGFSIPASGSAFVAYNIPAAQQTATVTVGFQVKFSSMPGSYTIMLGWRGDAGATVHTTLRVYNPSGNFAFYRSSPQAVLGSPVQHGIVTGTWYFVEASLSLSDTAGQGIVRKNGSTLYATAATEDTKSGGTASVIDQIRFSGATSLAYIVDDIYIRNDLTFQGS